LKKLNLLWQFQQGIYLLDIEGRPRVWTPDFYLPELGIYIEVCGSKDFDYDYRAKVYRKNKIPTIFVHQYKSQKYWQKYLNIKSQD